MEASKEEQRDVASFLTAECVGGREIHRRMEKIYGEHSMSLSEVHNYKDILLIYRGGSKFELGAANSALVVIKNEKKIKAWSAPLRKFNTVL